jgi:RNA polymerase sigma factor (TIGR02999 family)
MGGAVVKTLAALISAAETQDGSEAEALFGALYSELHRVARRELARNAGGCTLGPTALLHQAYIDMAGREGPEFPDRPRFMAYAARVMRGLIIDYMRNRHAQKRGGGFEITSLVDDAVDASAEVDELTRVSQALDELAIAEPPLAEIVDLKFFCGFSFVEIAAMRGVTDRTVQRQWQKARIYLHHSLGNDLLS